MEDDMLLLFATLFWELSLLLYHRLRADTRSEKQHYKFKA